MEDRTMKRTIHTGLGIHFTFIMLAVRSDLVNMKKLPENIEIQQRTRTAIPFVKGQSLADMAPHALFVLPTGSTKEDGNAILDIVVKSLTELISNYSKLKL